MAIENENTKALVHQTLDGRTVITTYTTDSDAEQITKALASQGVSTIGAMSLKEAKDFENRCSRSSQIDDWDHLRR